MPTIKTKLNLSELALSSVSLETVDSLKAHHLVVGTIDEEGKFLATGWLKSLHAEGDILVATVYPANEGDTSFECTIYNPRCVTPRACPRCVLDSHPERVERLLGCDETHAWTTLGKVLVSELSVIVKPEDNK